LAGFYPAGEVVGDLSPAAVSPSDHVNEMIVAIDKSKDMAGIYAAGEGEEGEVEDEDLFNDEIDYVPHEAVPAEMGVEGRNGDEVPSEEDPLAPEAEPQEEWQEEITCEPCGEVKANTWADPVKPTKAEVRAHNLTHCPYRSWCSVCVEAMGREDPHVRKGPPEESELPIVGMDYDKYGEEESVSDQVTTIVVKDSDSGQIKAHVVEVKGPKDEWVVKKICKDVEGFGHSALILKTDGEPALVAVQSRVIAKREARTVPENPPAYDPKANGAIEKGVQDINARLRLIRIALQGRVGKKLPIRHPIFEWGIEHAAFVHNRYQVGHDGCTPWRRSTGRTWKQKVVEFGEQVLGKLAPRRAATRMKTRTVHRNKMATRGVKAPGAAW